MFHAEGTAHLKAFVLDPCASSHVSSEKFWVDAVLNWLFDSFKTENMVEANLTGFYVNH